MKKSFFITPYKGEKGEHLIKHMKRRILRLLPLEIKRQVAYTGRKLSTCFNIKDPSKFEHQRDVAKIHW